MGGSLDPNPDPTNPFYSPEEWNPEAAHERAGLRFPAVVKAFCFEFNLKSAVEVAASEGLRGQVIADKSLP
jgi:hypothetical protein